ncbi:hypothetical protein OCUBac04_51940 (plasmid) [Klebsiella pneumoniae]|nr:hypothetical protein OCUBac04_51940 [Klebsiella pneumoniae]
MAWMITAETSAMIPCHWVSVLVFVSSRIMPASATIAIVKPAICIEFVFSFKNKTDAIKTATGMFENIMEASPELTYVSP